MDPIKTIEVNGVLYEVCDEEARKGLKNIPCDIQITENGRIILIGKNGQTIGKGEELPASADGCKWYNGTDTSSVNANEGDYYLCTGKFDSYVLGDVLHYESEAWVRVANIQGPKGTPGAKGGKGDPGVYVGESEPTDDSTIWLNPAGDALPIKIGENNNWYIGDVDTGKPSRGEDGIISTTGVTSDNKFNNVFDTTGKIDLTTGEDSSATTLHRTSGYCKVWDGFDGTVYIGVPAKATDSEEKTTVLFYKEDKSYIGYVYCVATTAPQLLIATQAGTNLNLENITQAKYYRVYKTASWDVQIYISPIAPPSASEIDYTYTEGTIPLETTPKKLQGKVVVNFGDSIFGKRRPPEDISTKLADLTGATVYNCGFGGCHMSNHFQETYNAFSMCNLADALATGTWTAQENALTVTGATAVPNYFSEGLAILKSLDFNKVDIITIAYGTNDWNSGDALDNADSPKSKDTYAGALRYSIETLLDAYPNLKIFVCSQTYRFFLDTNGSFENDSDTKVNNKSVGLTDFVAKTEEVAKAYHLPYIDNYYALGLNKYNRGQYFGATDGTHPLALGCHLIAEHMANELF